MLDQRNDFERGPDAKPVLALIALVAISTWCLKTCLGAERYVLDFAVNMMLWFGGYLLALLSVLALVVSLGAWIVRKLRSTAWLQRRDWHSSRAGLFCRSPAAMAVSDGNLGLGGIATAGTTSAAMRRRAAEA